MTESAIILVVMAAYVGIGWCLWAVFSPDASKRQRDVAEFILYMSPEFGVLAFLVKWIRR